MASYLPLSPAISIHTGPNLSEMPMNRLHKGHMACGGCSSAVCIGLHFKTSSMCEELKILLMKIFWRNALLKYFAENISSALLSNIGM